MKIQSNPKIKFSEILLTTIMFGWILAALLGGGYLIGIVKLPESALTYIGGALVAYVIVGFMAITSLCAKFMLNKKA